MVRDGDRAKFQDIEDFLKALVSGIAAGNKALEDVQALAASKFGTLVMKEGDISAQFEISSNVAKAGVEGPQLGLGVRTVQPLLPTFPIPLLLPFGGTSAAEGTGQPQNPFLGILTENNRKVSEAKITLKLVRIAPTPEEPPVEKRVLEPNLTVLEPGPIIRLDPNDPLHRPEAVRPDPIPATAPPSETAQPPAGGTRPPAGASQPPATPAQPGAGTSGSPSAAPQPPASAPQLPRSGRRPQQQRRRPTPGAEPQAQASGQSVSGGMVMPREMREAAASALRNALATLITQVPFLLVSEQQRRSIIADLNRIGVLLEQGNVEAATQEFANFAQQYGAMFGAT